MNRFRETKLDRHAVRRRGLALGLEVAMPLVRFRVIHQMIAAGNYPSVAQMAGDIEVSTKTIYRDLDFLRDQLRLPIEFSRQHNGWYYSRPVNVCPICSGRRADPRRKVKVPA